MKLILRNIQYHPNADGTGAVALLLEHPFGAFFLNTDEPALTARTPDGAGIWDNDEAIAEATALLATAESFAAATKMSPDLFPADGFDVELAAVPASTPAEALASDAAPEVPAVPTTLMLTAGAPPA